MDFLVHFIHLVIMVIVFFGIASEGEKVACTTEWEGNETNCMHA